MNTNLNKVTLSKTLNNIIESKVPYTYLALFCKVTEHYLKQCLNGSKPMTGKLHNNIYKGIKLYQNESKKIEREQSQKEVVTDLKSDPIVIVKKEEPTVVYKNRSLKETLVAFGEHFGISQHNMEFNNGKYHYIFRLDISESDE